MSRGGSSQEDGVAFAIPIFFFILVSVGIYLYLATSNNKY